MEILISAAVGYFVSKVIDSTVARLSKTASAQRAARRVDSEFHGRCEGVEYHLLKWLARPAVVNCLETWARGKQPSSESAELLLAEFIGVGFDVPDDRTDLALEVLAGFFRCLHEELLLDPEEGPVYMADYLTKEIRTQGSETRKDVKQLASEHKETRAQITEMLDILRSGHHPPLVASNEALIDAPIEDEKLANEYQAVRQMLAMGKAHSALDWLEAKKVDGDVNSDPMVRYEWYAHRGLAMMQTGDLEAAEEELRTAMEIKPDWANGVANVAMICLLREKNEEAKEIAKSAVEMDASNESALKVLAQALVRDGKVDEALEAGARLSKTGERCHLLGVIHLNAGAYEKAIDELNQALELTPDNGDLKLMLCQAELGFIQERVRELGLSAWQDLPSDLDAAVDRSANLLDEAIEWLSIRDDKARFGVALITRLHLLCSFGRGDPTEDYETVSAQGVVTPFALATLVEYLGRENETERALKYIEDYRLSNGFDANIELMYALFLAGCGRQSEALEVLKDERIEASVGEIRATLGAVDIHLSQSNLEAAGELLDKLDADLSEWEVALRVADLQGRQGEQNAAIDALRSAIETCPLEHKWRVQLALVDELGSAKRWDDVADVLREVISVNAPPRLARKYMVALVRADRIGECLEFAGELRRERGVLRDCARLEASLLSQIGELDEADSVYRQLLEDDAGNVQWILERAKIAWRQGKPDDAKRLLPDAQSASELPLEDAAQAVALFAETGNELIAMECAHQTFKRNRINPQAHTFYVTAFLRLSPRLREHLDSLEIRPGVEVQLDDGKEVVAYDILEEGEQPSTDRQLAHDSALTVRLLGKTVGEEVAIGELLGKPESRKIVAIRTKYVATFQDVLKNYNTMFPDQGDLWRVDVSNDGIHPILESVDAQSEWLQKLEDSYQSTMMPVCVLARLLKKNDIVTWYMLISGALGKVHVYAAAPEERARLSAAAIDNAPLVVEATTLCALNEFGVLTKLPLLGRRVLVSQSLLDLLDSALIEQKAGPKLGLGKVGGQYVREEVSDDDSKRGQEFLEQLIVWVRENCEIVGVPLASGDNYLEATEVLSPSAADAMLIAKGEGACLATEDLRLRLLAANVHGVRGTAALEIMNAMVEQEILESGALEVAKVRTGQWGYHFTPVTIEMLLSALRVDENMAGLNLKALLRLLEDPGQTTHSVAGVIAGFLREVWLMALTAQQKQMALFACLEALGRRPSWSEMRSQLDMALSIQFKLIHIPLLDIRQQIEAWASVVSQ